MTSGDTVRRRYDLGVAAVERLRELAAPLTAVTFELWFQGGLEPDGRLAAELSRIEADGTQVCDALTEELAARHLSSHRLLRGLRGGDDRLTKELVDVRRVLVDVCGDQRQFGRDVSRTLDAMEAGGAAADALEKLRSLQVAARKVREKGRHAELALAASQAAVQDLQDQLEHLRREVETDGLTGLANRKAFDLALASRLDRGAPILLALLDIDHFKRFNDTWGHTTGDQVLRSVGAAIGEVGRPPRVAARYGGEEFALIFTDEDAGSVETSLAALQARLRRRLLTRRTTGEQLGSTTVSIGLAAGRPGEAGEALVSRADEALYASKRAGRDRLTFANS